MSKGRAQYRTSKKNKEKDPLKAKKDMINLAIIVIGVAIGIVLGMALNSMSLTQKGAKIVAFEVEIDGQVNTLKANVMAEELYSAIEQCKDIAMVDGKLIKVKDYTIDSAKGEYWSVYDGDVEVTDALKETKIADGQRFRVVLNK